MQANPISSGDVGESLAERIMCNLETGGFSFDQAVPPKPKEPLPEVFDPPQKSYKAHR